VKVTVFGFGNQKLYERINVAENYGGEPPFGGAGMALDFARAGHEVVLSDPFLDEQDPEHVSKLEEAGVQLTTDDAEAVQDAEIIILFTPFGKTPEIVHNVAEDIPEGAVICTTCTCNPMAVFLELTDMKIDVPEEVGVTAFHPAGIPGTETQKIYLSTRYTDMGNRIVTDEQFERLVELAESAGKELVELPSAIHVSIVGDVVIVLTRRILAALAEFLETGTWFAPEEMLDVQAQLTLYTLASLVEKLGIRDALRTFDAGAVEVSFENMKPLIREPEGGLDAYCTGDLKEDFVILPSNMTWRVLDKIVGRAKAAVSRKALEEFFLFEGEITPPLIAEEKAEEAAPAEKVTVEEEEETEEEEEGHEEETEEEEEDDLEELLKEIEELLEED